jgi:hypothetical protein
LERPRSPGVLAEEEIAMTKTLKHSHELAFYLGLNAALIIVISSAVYAVWPL